MTKTALSRIKVPRAFAGLRKPARYKAYYGGRGGAKSHSFALELLLQAGKEKLRVLCAREVQNSIKDSVKQLLDDKIAALGLESFYESTQHEIRGANGSQFIFAGLGAKTTDQIKSMAGIDRAWVEESQTISARSLEILIPTIRKDNSEIWFSWNPRHASDPVDQRFRGLVVPDDAIIKKVNHDANPFFPKTLSAEMEFDRKNAPGRFAHTWLGEYEPMAIGAIWDRQTLHEGRRAEVPPMERILVGVDHAISAEEGSNEHGIIVAGVGADGRGYVLDDMTTSGQPKKWGSRAVAAFDKWQADAVVIERNQGGDLVRENLHTIRPGLPVIEVHATRGKHVRAEPISSLYSLGRISHVGTFPDLEDQMCLMTAGGFEGEGSPDRCDALVWALTELFPQMTVSRYEDELDTFDEHYQDRSAVGGY
jgi:hypothetical protein